jgi:hypothetical protein
VRKSIDSGKVQDIELASLGERLWLFEAPADVSEDDLELEGDAARATCWRDPPLRDGEVLVDRRVLSLEEPVEHGPCT